MEKKKFQERALNKEERDKGYVHDDEHVLYTEGSGMLSKHQAILRARRRHDGLPLEDI